MSLTPEIAAADHPGGELLRCVVLDDYQGVARDHGDWHLLEGICSVEFWSEHLVGQDLVDAARDADVIIAMRERTGFSAEVLRGLTALKLLVTTGPSNTLIDLDVARELGVVVCGTASLIPPPAEMTWAIILAAARHVAAENASLRADGPWQHTVGMDLAGSTLGIVGLGRIGERISKVARAFDMDVLAWSRSLDDERAAAAGVRRAASLEDLLSASDIVSVHLRLTAQTRGILDADRLAHMRPHALLVNTSRGPLVDLDAVVDALDEGRLGGYAADTFDAEPLPSGHPGRTHPKILATPHLGYVSHASLRAYFDGAIEDIVAWSKDSPIRVLT